MARLLKTASTHQTSWLGLADTLCSSAFEAVARLGRSPATALAERGVVSLLQRMDKGSLTIVTSYTRYSFGNDAAQKCGEPVSEIRVINDAFWLRLFAMSDLGFSEAFMYGDINLDPPSLLPIFKLFILNREALASLSSGPVAKYLVAYPQAYLTNSRFVNSLANSRSNISAHYDISNEMFEAFLSEDMTYSCAIFENLDEDVKLERKLDGAVSELNTGLGLKSIRDLRTLPSGVADSGTPASPSSGGFSSDSESENAEGTGTSTPVTSIPSTPRTSSVCPEYEADSQREDPLYEAQMRKLRHIIKKADIRKGHRVLEIGSGWGSFSILAVQMTGCTLDTLTLSSEQASLARSRITAAGLSSSITVHLLDYRNIPAEWDHAFDRVVSIEMIEAVGHEYLETYWGVLHRAMKEKDAVGVVQVITIPEARLEKYTREVDFIRKWVRGFLPSLTVLISSLERGTSGKLVVDSVSNIGPHYARTLREWRNRFEAKFDEVIVPALRRTYPDTMGLGPKPKTLTNIADDEIAVFRRKWLYYYSYCEIGFTERILGDHIITFTREGNVAYGCEV